MSARGTQENALVLRDNFVTRARELYSRLQSLCNHLEVTNHTWPGFFKYPEMENIEQNIVALMSNAIEAQQNSNEFHKLEVSLAMLDRRKRNTIAIRSNLRFTAQHFSMEQLAMIRNCQTLLPPNTLENEVLADSDLADIQETENAIQQQQAMQQQHQQQSHRWFPADLPFRDVSQHVRNGGECVICQD